MATSSVSSSTNFVNALGAGSGMDVKALAENLVNAEKVPREEALNKKIDLSNAKISGYSAVRYVLDQFKVAFQGLNTASDFNTMLVSNSQTSAFNVTASNNALASQHSIEVTQLARPQRNTSAPMPLSSSGLGTSLALSVGDTNYGTIESDGSPAGIVNAINARKKETGVSAQLVKVNASQFQIVVSGPTGVANSVSLMGNSGELQFNADNAVQTATDAALTVDGLNLTRSTNQISDVLEGVTFDLKGLTSGAAQLNLSTDTAPLKEKITKLVSAYNDIQSVLTDAYNKDSKVAEYGASLVGDSTVQTIRAQLRSLVTANSSTTSGSVKALRDLGVSLDSSGQMTLDNAKLDNALANQYDDVVKMLSNNIKTDVTPSTGNGIANDGIKKITDLLSNTGILVSQSKNAVKRIDEYKEQLAKLNDRMTLLLARYNKQFSAMESIVGQSKSLQTSLTSSFEGMMATYTKN